MTNMMISGMKHDNRYPEIQYLLCTKYVTYFVNPYVAIEFHMIHDIQTPIMRLTCSPNSKSRLS
jgi:hypothetical protein